MRNAARARIPRRRRGCGGVGLDFLALDVEGKFETRGQFANEARIGGASPARVA